MRKYPFVIPSDAPSHLTLWLSGRSPAIGVERFSLRAVDDAKIEIQKNGQYSRDRNRLPT